MATPERVALGHEYARQIPPVLSSSGQRRRPATDRLEANPTRTSDRRKNFEEESMPDQKSGGKMPEGGQSGREGGTGQGRQEGQGGQGGGQSGRQSGGGGGQSGRQGGSGGGGGGGGVERQRQPGTGGSEGREDIGE